MKKAAEYLGVILVILLMAFATFTYVAPHYGWRVDAVLTGSMEPSLDIGSLVVSRPADPESIVVGDIITFRPNSGDKTTVTHRVVGIERNSPLRFLTKGDANVSLDPFTVSARNLVGKVYFNAPYWGYFTEFLKTPWGFAFGLAIPGIVVVIFYITNLWRALSRNGREKAGEVVSE